ncbi:MAG: amino acid adenylation domain-containing protein [Firmicutes bacterium]|nr:amino acid adenylation domain-containing protein [Bacillota bacterium]
MFGGAKGVKRILTAGERPARIYFDDTEVYNVYGMSETLCGVCVFRLDKKYDDPPIGRPLPDVEASIENIDEETGMGELYLKGHFADSYYKLPEETAKTFEKQPDGTVLVHTGDIVYKNENGDIVFGSRRDWMVKINGQRVEMMGIETLMASVDGVTNAAVRAFTDNMGQTYLAAFYTADKDIRQSDIINVLNKKLPSYMIPRYFKKLDEMPKNANGKLDRTALVPPTADEYKAEYIPPENEIQQRLCLAMEQVLGCGKIGKKDDFIRLGGDSIKVLALIAAAELDGLTPNMILSGRTVENIEKLYINADTAAAAVHFETLEDSYPLTEAQTGVYLECINEPNSKMYNIPVCCELPKNIDIDRFMIAAEKVFKVHKVLGTGIGVSVDGTPSMFPLKYNIDIQRITADSIESALDGFIRTFDLENGPLCRAALIACGGKNYFVFDIHHIIFDGSSVNVIVSQIARAYDGIDPKEEKLDIFDISKFEKNLKTSEEYKAAREYFKNVLGEADTDSHPVSDVIRTGVEKSGGTVRLPLNDALSIFDGENFARKNGVTENTIFLGAFAYTLAKFNGASDSLFCTVTNGRHDKRLDESVGMFVKTLPMYFNISDEDNVGDTLSKIGDYLFDTMSHDCISFGELAEEYGVDADIMFVYQSELFNGAKTADGGISIEHCATGDVQSNMDVMIMKYDTGYELVLHYRRDIYSEELMKNFAYMYANVVKGIITQNRFGDIEFTDSVAGSILDGFNNTDIPYDDSLTVTDLFCAQAKKTPDNTAVVYNDISYTYKQLDETTDILAKNLRAEGIGRETVTAVLIPRCEYMVTASLGILKAGGAYLPLDPTYPPERLELMVKDSGAKVLITVPELSGMIKDFDGRRIMLSEIPEMKDNGLTLEPPKPNDLFIMLYTSGSTGVPKGVMIEHRNVFAFFKWYIKDLGVDETSHASAYASYGFDACMQDLYPVLMSGGCVYIIPDDMRLELDRLHDYFVENSITHSFMTTQIGRQFALMEPVPSMKALVVGGEKLVPFTPPAYTVLNGYGPTECCMGSSMYRVGKNEKDIPIGKPIDNLKFYIVDKNGKLLPPGASGELWIAGPQVSRGYLGRPEQTAAAFTKNPFTNDKKYNRVYHTGDIVRFMPSGDLQFIGRRDAQVKIRGFRIELTEVEEVIRRFDGIKDATVAAFDDPAGGKYIAAYIVSDEETDIAALNAFILAEKPPYMVPAVTVRIDKIPYTQNQKVNKRALPVPKRRAENVLPPQNDMQQRIFDCIAEVIGHKEFGINTNIYDAGLSSIGSVRLNVILSAEFGISFRNAELKANNTVEKLEAFIGEGKTAEEYEVFADYGITRMQEGVFVDSVAKANSTVYNIPTLLELDGDIDTDKLKTAIVSAVDAHSYIKTRLFYNDDGDIRQRRLDGDVFDEDSVEIIHTDRLESVKDSLVTPFKLIGGRLFRVKIIEADKKYLFIEMHHIISDGYSVGILLNDITKAYSGIQPEKEKYSGFEVVLDEQKQRGSEFYPKAKRYYADLLDGVETECLPYGDVFENVGETAGTLEFVGSAVTAEDAVHYCNVNKVSLNAFFTSVFGFVLSKYNYADGAVFAGIYNGRNDSRVLNTVNMLVKTLPVVTDISGENKSVYDYVSNVSKQLIDSQTNDIYSFAEISREFSVSSDVIFAYQGSEFGFDSLCGKPAALVDISLDTLKSPLSVFLSLKNNRVHWLCEYSTARYSRKYIEVFLGVLDKVCEEFLQKKQLKDISLITAQAEKLNTVFNSSDKPYDENETVVGLFAEQAALHPDNIAVVYGNIRCTYGELDKISDILAKNLRAEGIGRETVTAVLIPRCEYMVTASLGILKAGGAYLPLDPTYPPERLELMVKDSGAKVLITVPELSGMIKDFDGRRIMLSEIPEMKDNGLTLEPPKPNDLFIMLYTSGSTGVPKGVMLEHGNLTAFCAWHKRYYKTSEKTRTAAYASYGFDACMNDIYPALTVGGSVYIIPEDMRLDFVQLHEYFKQNGLTNSFMTTQIGRQFALMPHIDSLEFLTVGGEKLVPVQPPAETALCNGYGPTECTIFSTMYRVRCLEKDVPIGRPLDNMKMYIVDKNGKLLPPGASGELWIAGPQVSRGYLGRPEQTAAVFTKNPFTDDKKYSRVYRTGDIVHFALDGNVQFIGRRDAQVKIRGFRIELSEVQEVISRFNGIKDTAVVAFDDNAGGKYLAAYIVSDGKVDMDALKNFILAEKPPYMVPLSIMQIDRIPYTQNQKVNKRALPVPKRETQGGREPVNETEKLLCDIFAQSLGLEKVYADDDFFEMGGTSIIASKLVMKCVAKKLPVVYKDIFDYSTPQALAKFIAEEQHDTDTVQADKNIGEDKKEALYEVLEHNVSEEVNDISYTPVRKALVTGVTGFLGAHVVKELIDSGAEKIYCLARSDETGSAEERMKVVFMYYFDDTFSSLFGSRIIPMDGNITDAGLLEKLRDADFDTLINCAACVKHFANDDILEKVNFRGVENLVNICVSLDKKLIHVSTLSVGGESVNNSVPENVVLRENMLSFGQTLENKYALTKWQGEKAVLTAIKERGLRAKIMRAGNLMGREKDGEFQANFSTNGFMSRLKAYSAMGCFPIGELDREVEFSAIDCTARAVVLLAGTPDKFTVFHVNSCRSVHMANVLKALARVGVEIEVVSDEDYIARFNAALADEKSNIAVSPLIAYNTHNKGLRLVGSKNEFSVKALYRLSFMWPIVEESYIAKVANALVTLEYFD